MFDPVVQGDEKLPTTKDQLLSDLRSAAQAIIEDRTGIRLDLRRHVQIVARVIRDWRVKERAASDRGPHCQICDFTFRKRDGQTYYYECHHIVPVSKGGPDAAGNILVLCANHHRQMHYAEVDWPSGVTRPAEVAIDGQLHAIKWPPQAKRGRT
ncbi:MAG: HNH endonuclease [Chromatiaceae bacterium]|nr:HNH endonuclease [Chromatiaceae bacterium]